MSATELIEQVKALPRSEQKEFAEWFHQWEARGNGHASRESAKPFRVPDFEARLKQRFPEGGLHGDPQEFWAELREERF